MHQLTTSIDLWHVFLHTIERLLFFVMPFKSSLMAMLQAIEWDAVNLFMPKCPLNLPESISLYADE